MKLFCEAAAGQSMKRRYKNLRDKETPSTHNDRKIMVVHGSGTKNKICCQEGELQAQNHLSVVSRHCLLL